MPLAKNDLKRLQAMLGIAQSTQHDGEAINALRKAIALCTSHKLSLFEGIRAASKSELDTARLAALEADAYKRGQQAASERAKEEFAKAAIDAGVAYERGVRDGKVAAGRAYAEAMADQAFDAAYAQAKGAVPQAGTQAGAPNAWEAFGIQMAAYQAMAPAAQLWRDAAATLLLHHKSRLNAKSIDFLQSILSRGWSTLTTAQDNWLVDLARRCGVDYSGQGI